jgi:hypothetical protein
MLPDFRFVLGAILAITMLAVAGLGLLTSVRLLHEAQMNPLEDQRSLAFAGHAEWNQFYDPDGARRFEGLAGKSEGEVVQARLEAPAGTAAPAPPAIAPPVNPEERTASIPPSRADPDLVPFPAEDKTPEPDPPHTDPPRLAETAAAAPPAITPPVNPEEQTAGIPPSRAEPDIVTVPAEEKTPETDPHTDSPRSAETAAATIAAPPEPATGAPERVASAPAASPGPDHSQATQMPAREPAQPHASGDPLPVSAPPIPPPRPKAPFRKKIARVHIRRVSVASHQQEQPLQNSGFPAPWPGYDDKSIGATTTKKTTGKLTGTLTNRPQ